jgi:two-component system sensor histidine kinase CiaH
MIQTLQKKFIFTAMIAITVLLVVLLGAINLMNYSITHRQIEQTIHMVADQEGLVAHAHPQNPRQNEPFFLKPPSQANAAMSARYFLVYVQTNGTVEHTVLNHIASVTQDDAEKLAQQALKSSQPQGKLSPYYYEILDDPLNSGQILIFLDTTSQRYSYAQVFLLSFGLGIAAWLCMLLLVILLSKKAIAPIARNIEKQKEFVTNAGHEIKTPLAIILANTEAMELCTGENKWSRNIRSQTLRLSGLMQNLLTLSKMEENSGELPTQDFSFSEMLEESIRSFAESAALRQITLQAHVQPEISLHANAESIRQLLSILLDNAVKYANDSGEIQVSLEKSGKHIRLQVQNTCQTMPDGDLKKLFDRFYRGDSARTQKSGGYGIGLSAARAIAANAHGSLTASRKGENTICFTAEFPESKK